MTTDRTTTANSGLAKVAVPFSADTFVGNQTLVFQIKFCGKSPALRVAANRPFGVVSDYAVMIVSL
jgi:hypothetical protein